MCAASVAIYRHLAPQLPDVSVLRDFRYQIPMSVHSADGKLIAQFGEKKRTPLAMDEIPKEVIFAFLAAEDDRFFEHPGVDYQGLLRAALTLVRTGEKRQGGSTITMQVARNFFLSSEKTFFRKVKEIMLAIKIDAELSKDQILELYLNKIYFGHHAYGVEAASEVYFGKRLTELTLAEIAMIAGLPKAPSTFNPVANPERAHLRRDYVLRRMLQLQFINDREFTSAVAEPVAAKLHSTALQFASPYAAEMVRAEMYQQYGEDAYEKGYSVFTTLDTGLQGAAENALRNAVYDYDERHGYRGAKQRLDLRKFRTSSEWDSYLSHTSAQDEQTAGIVVGVNEKSADVYIGHGTRISLNWEGIRWARRYLNEDATGPYPKSAKEVLHTGEVIRIRRTAPDVWRLAQTVEVEGALVALKPSSGAIAAVSGGIDFSRSKFNRATQARRQPGSGFKPILYAAALHSGFTPATIINDAPLTFFDPSQDGGTWRPQNYTNRFYGPTRLREALVKSRNLVSIRLLREIGIEKAVSMAMDFGFPESDLPRSLTLALGSGSATPLKMAQAFCTFANGGFRVEPYLIDRIETQDGRALFRATPSVACADCSETGKHVENLARRILSPQVHYMMNSMLQDVIREGTAMSAMQLGRSDIAGKTGTTNEQRDAWFNGYSPDLVATTWLGFDSSKPLGDGETGGHAALPMWIDFMRHALEGTPERSFPVPDGLTTAVIDKSTGQLAYPGSSNSRTEFFPIDSVPKTYASPRVLASEVGTDSKVSDEEASSPSNPARDVGAPPTNSRPQQPLDSLF